MLRGFVVLLVAAAVFATATMLTGCSGNGKTVAPQNLPPSINAIQLTPPRTAPGDTITASAIAGDPEGLPLTFLWRASAGTLIDSLSQSVEWIAPSVAATCTLTVHISDGTNEVSMTRAVPVGVGCLVIESYPQGATILIDSEPTQYSTPLTISDAAAGSYRLGVERSPYVYSPGSSNVEVTDGSTVRVRFKLNEEVMSLTQMVTSNCISQTSWSSDGGMIACAVKNSGWTARKVYLFDSPWGDSYGYVKQATADSWAPSWNPTKCSVVFAHSGGQGVNWIYKFSMDCSPPYDAEPMELAYTGTGNYPVWSPDGGQIAFVTDEDGSFSLKTVAKSGGSATTIATDVVEDRPSWSPGGDQIVFSKNVGGEPYLFTVPSAGGTPAQVSQVAGEHPSWSPDGHKVAYVSSQDGTENVWILFLDATPTPVEGQLTSTGANWPAWKPDGTGLCFTVPENSGDECGSLWLATNFPF